MRPPNCTRRRYGFRLLIHTSPISSHQGPYGETGYARLLGQQRRRTAQLARGDLVGMPLLRRTGAANVACVCVCGAEEQGLPNVVKGDTPPVVPKELGIVLAAVGNETKEKKPPLS